MEYAWREDDSYQFSEHHQNRREMPKAKARTVQGAPLECVKRERLLSYQWTLSLRDVKSAIEMNSSVSLIGMREEITSDVNSVSTASGREKFKTSLNSSVSPIAMREETPIVINSVNINQNRRKKFASCLNNSVSLINASVQSFHESTNNDKARIEIGKVA